MKVLKLAFGHPDNVFSLCSHLSEKTDLTLVFVVCGKNFRQGVLDLELNGKDYGLHTDPAFFEALFPETITGFVGNKHKVWILKLPSRKVLGLNNWRICWWVASALRKEKFDVVHYNGFSPFIYLFYLRFRSRAAQFWTLHDYKHHSGERKVKAERINRMLAGLRGLTVIQHYDYLRGRVIEEFNLPAEKVRTLLSGPLDVFHSFEASYRLCPPEPFILFFGRVSKYKGVDLLLEAYAGITSAKPKLVVAGSGKFWFDISPYENKTDILLLNEYIENEELLGLIRRSLFIVVPYRDATHSAVIATAYAMNKPVVASDVDGLKEVVADKVTGRLTPPGSSDALRIVLEELIRQPGQLEDYQANIKQEKQSGKISWNRITDEYLELYSEKLKEQ